MKQLSPIALFVYNRPTHTRATIEALKNNLFAKESDLFIFSDGAKDQTGNEKIMELREYLKTVEGFNRVTIIEREKNYGLAESIILGVTEVIDRFGKIIVLEDDLVTSPNFLEYMNNALDMYENEDKVISIHGYTYPIKSKLPETFFLRGADCWGWATWKRGWEIFEPDGKKLLKQIKERGLIKEFDFGGSFKFSDMLKRQVSGKTNSWAIRWYASAFLSEKLTLYPGRSLIKNIGLTGTEGTHLNSSSVVFSTELSTTPINLQRIEPSENITARKIITEYFETLRPSLIRKLLNKLKTE